MPDSASDISSFTGVFRANLTGENRKVTKRNRQPISCAACRARKAKCDRQQPCGSCSKRGEADTCGYGANAAIPVTKTRAPSQTEAQARLQKLERMVSDMIKAASGDSTAPDPDLTSLQVPTSHIELLDKVESLSMNKKPVEAPTPARYKLSTLDTDMSFVGATHWSAILDGLHDIRESLEVDDDPHLKSVPEPMVHDMYFGSMELLSIEQILAVLPSRSVVDNILSIYFSNRFFLTPFIHAPAFQRHYNAFWENPAAASFMWLSSLFSSLCIGVTLAVRCGRGPSLGLGDISPKVFLDKAGQCIISGQYMRAQPYAIEALLLYTHSKYIRCVDPDPALWAIVSLIVRLAQKQGMHRQPENLPGNMRPFDAEIRRRTWFYIETFDLLLSFQLGMPPIINEKECDINPPSNLLDSDFDEDTVVLPPERPNTEITPMLFYGHKARIIRLFRRVHRHALAAIQPPCEETMELDRALHKEHDALPEYYKIKPIRETAFTDQIHEIMHRMMLEMLYLKSLCVLHRPYLSQAKRDPRYQMSRETCNWASLKILDLQAEFHHESRPGGRLHEDKWILTSLTAHDFLMAAMIAGVALVEAENLTPSDRIRRLSALTTSYNIWSEKKHISRDATHACKVLASILAKVTGKTPGSNADSNSGIQVPQTEAAAPSTLPDLSGSAATLSTTGTLDLTPPSLSMEDLQELQTDFDFSFDGQFDYMDLDPLGDVLGDTSNLDWGTIDYYLHNLGPDLEAPNPTFEG